MQNLFYSLNIPKQRFPNENQVSFLLTRALSAEPNLQLRFFLVCCIRLKLL